MSNLTIGERYTPARTEYCDSCNALITGDAVWVEDKGFENYDDHVWVFCLKCSDTHSRKENQEIIDELRREKVGQDMP